MLFKVGEQFPPKQDIERLASYQANVRVYEGRHDEIVQRASELLKDSPYAEQIKKLYLVNQMADVIATKPSELLLSEPPIVDTPKSPDSIEQKAVQRLSEENDIRNLVFDLTVGAAVRGDMFLKVMNHTRQDFSELQSLKFEHPELNIEELLMDVRPEILMQAITPEIVFPEIGRGVGFPFKAINIAYIEWVVNGTDKIPYLVVERNLPFFIQHKRFKLKLKYVNDLYHNEKIPVYDIVDEVPTGKQTDLVYTKVPVPLVFHFAYKHNDYKWNGTGIVEKIAQLLAAISDRLVALDFVIHKHSDPLISGPAIQEGGELLKLSGAYIARGSEDPEVKYVTWDGHLEAGYKELDILISKVFFQAQLPPWLFGSSITDASRSGGGLSHTDSSAIKLRYAPVSALLDRLNSNLIKTLGDAFYYAQILENYTHAEQEGFEPYEPTYPMIKLSDGIPKNEEEVTNNAINRVNAKLLDRLSAVKLMDGVNDLHAKEMLDRIDEETKDEFGVVDPSILANGSNPTN